MTTHPVSLDDTICFAPREDIDTARQRHFATTMDLVAERHPYYRTVMAENGLRRADFAALADLARLPVTTKQDYMAEPDAFRLATDGLPDEMRVVWDVMYTTGSTSGQPTPFVSTAYDFYNVLTLNRNMLRLRGVRDTDVIANLFPLTKHPHGAFTRAQQAAAVFNIPVVAALPGNPSPYFQHGNRIDAVVSIVERHRATILWGVPSFVRQVLQRADALGADFSAVRMVFVTGEALFEEARADLTEKLTALGATDPVISGSYGMTEIQGGFVECTPGAGFHNPLPDQIFVEVVDAETHEPVPDGDEGLVLISHLNRRGTVLLRYALGDVSVLSREPCPDCGATTDRLIKSPRRVDALVKIKGMLVNPDPVLAQLATDAAVAQFQLAVEHADQADPLSPDALRLRVAPTADDPDLAGRLRDLVKRETGVTPEVEVVDGKAFDQAESTWKAKPFVDRRTGSG